MLQIQISDGTLCEWGMGRGTRQGDSTGSDAFGDTYNTALASYKEECRDPVTLRFAGGQVDASMAAFVDDIVDFFIADTAGEMHRKVAARTESLQRNLAAAGAEPEPEKEKSS